MSTYTPISTQTLSANTTTVTFSGIPQTYTDLVLVITGKNSGTTSGDFTIRVGNSSVDSGSNYSRTFISGDGSSASSNRGSNQTSGFSSLALSTSIGMTRIQFMNYSNITTNKTFLIRNDISASITSATVGLWRSTSAINIIELSASANQFASDTTFTLYGIGAGSPKAFGGDEVTTDGTYWYHIYRSSGIFAPMQNLSCDYLVVAGGGGGRNGGGGAGGYRSGTLSVSSGTNQVVTIGAGGAGQTASPPTKGGDSVFATISATGGGRASTGTASEANGGSGGGAADGAGQVGGTGNQGSYSPAEGTNGGSGASGGAGGGGGHTSVGGNASSNTGGNGGSGTSNSISGSAVTYAAGGGGGGSSTGGSGTAGVSGNGQGGAGAAPTAGTANRGGGGGGGWGSNGAAGGSGTVIVRYSV
jgi:hypothetical protein